MAADCTGADAGDLLRRVGIHDLSHEFLVVVLATFQDMRHVRLLEQVLDLCPDALDGVVLGGVGNVIDDVNPFLEQELRDLLAVVHRAVVQEEHKCLRLASLEQSKNKLDEGVAFDGSGLDKVPFEADFRRHAAHDSHGWRGGKLFLYVHVVLLGGICSVQ